MNNFTILDGATGSNLMKSGLPNGVCVEQWILEHPEALQNLQKSFVEAGSTLVLAATFGAHPAKLSSFWLADKTEEFNTALINLSQQGVGDTATVLGDTSPTGRFMTPSGDASFKDLCDIYRPQMEVLKQSGVDTVLIETQMTLADARAALLCAKEAGLDAMVTITVGQNGRTLSGWNLNSAVVILGAMGAKAVGLNCSCGPVSMFDFIKEAYSYAKVPLIAKPNAGEPGNPLPPEEFGKSAAKLADAGATILGGCCGTTPEHIACLKAELLNYTPLPLANTKDYLADERNVYEMPVNPETEIIPCTEDLMDDIMNADPDADLLSITLKSAEDAHYLPEGLAVCRLPVCFQADDEAVLEAALRMYQGRAMIQGDGATEYLQQTYGAVLRNS